MGRPPELTDMLLTALKACFAKGLTRDEVAASCGVSRASLYRWIARGGRILEGHAWPVPPDILYCELAEAAELDRDTLRKRRRQAGRARHGR